MGCTFTFDSKQLIFAALYINMWQNCMQIYKQAKYRKLEGVEMAVMVVTIYYYHFKWNVFHYTESYIQCTYFTG